MDIFAEMDSVEFYKTKGSLQAGTYKIIEHDGEVNYCVLDGRFGGEKWYDEGELEEYEQELHKELNFEGNMRTMDEWDSLLDEPNDGLDNIPPSYHNDCGGCGTCHQCDNSSSVTGGQRDGMGGDCSASTLDGMMFKNNEPKQELSLGDILRASLKVQDELQS